MPLWRILIAMSQPFLYLLFDYIILITNFKQLSLNLNYLLMPNKYFQGRFFRHATYSNSLIAIGLLFSQTLMLPFINHLQADQSISRTITIILWISTLLLYGCVMSYFFKQNYSQFINVYEFLILPIFTMMTINQINAKSQSIILIPSLMMLFSGILISFLNIKYFYSRKIVDKNQNIMRISVHYRLLRIFRFAFTFLLYLVNTEVDYLFIGLSFTLLSILNGYNSISKFSFQNIYQQFLTIIFCVASLVSSIEGMAQIYDISQYSFVGQTVAILLILLQPSFLVSCLQLKYAYFMQKNIQMRDQHEMLGIFIIMKQIIFKQNSQFDYSTNFKNKIYLAYQKMLLKSKKLFKAIGYYNAYLQSLNTQGSSSLGSFYSFSAIQSILQERQVFQNLINVRLLKSDDFFLWEFYIISILDKQLRNFNKSISEFYKKRIDGKKQNFTQNIMKDILYTNIMKFIAFRQQEFRNHQIITFYQQFRQLTCKIKQICKNQTQIIALMSNNTQTPLNKYTQKLCNRHQLKIQINNQIQQMASLPFYKFSNNFLYTLLLYKLFFQREQQIIKQKLINMFLITKSVTQKQNQMLVYFQKVSVLVCSAINNGQILQSNQKFQKAYQPINYKRNSNAHKVYIGDILLYQSQKKQHQLLFSKSSQYQDPLKNGKAHIDYPCYILRNKRIRLEQQEDDYFMRIVQKVRISTRIYFCLTNSFNYICTIQSLPQYLQGVRVLPQEITKLQMNYINPKIIKAQTITQFQSQCKCISVSFQQLRDDEQGVSQAQDLQVNCSQQFNFNQDQNFNQEKVQKIQMQFQRQNYNTYKYQASLILAFILILLIYCAAIFFTQTYKYRLLNSDNQFINLNQELISNTLMAEKVAGLQLILYQHFQQGSFNNFCLDYANVQNMTKYLQNSLISFASSRFKSSQRMYLLTNFKQQHLINFMKKKNYSWFEQTQIKDIYMDYFKYIGLFKSLMFDYAQPFKQPQQDFRSSFESTISKVINQNSFKKTKYFYNSIQQSFYQNSSSLKFQFFWATFFMTGLAFILFVSLIIVLSKMIYNQKIHLLLLKQLKKQYFGKRLQQVKFITSQLGKIENSEYQKVQVDRNMNIQIQKQNGANIYTFQQLEKACQTKGMQKDQVNYVQTNVQIQQKNQSQKVSLISKSAKSTIQETDKNNLDNITINISVLKSFLMLKYPLILILMMFFGVLGLHIYDNSILTEKIQDNFRYYEASDDIRKVQQSMVDILTAEWLLFVNNPIYQGHEDLMNQLNLAINHLNTSNYIQKIRTTFDNQSAYNILYQDYCELSKKQQDKQKCWQFNQGTLRLGFSHLVSMTVNDASNIIKTKETYPELFEDEICVKLVIFLNYTEANFGHNLVDGYKKLHVSSQKAQSNLLLIEIVLWMGLMICSIILGIHLYKRSKITRTQVLSMQSKANLYQKYQDFRPFLNQLYYRRQ